MFCSTLQKHIKIESFSLGAHQLVFSATAEALFFKKTFDKMYKIALFSALFAAVSAYGGGGSGGGGGGGAVSYG